MEITKLKSSEFPEPEAGMIPVALGGTVNLPSLLPKASKPSYESFSVFYPKVLSCFKIMCHFLLTALSFLEVIILLINYIPKSSIFDAHAALGQRLFYPFSYPIFVCQISREGTLPQYWNTQHPSDTKMKTGLPTVGSATPHTSWKREAWSSPIKTLIDSPWAPVFKDSNKLWCLFWQHP